MPTITDLGQKVKIKYPGVYDDLSDDEVGQKVKQKYPGAYNDFTDVVSGTLKYDTLIEKPPIITGEKIANFFVGNVKKLGKTAGQSFALGGNIKDLNSSQNNAIKIQSDILSKIKTKRALGQDTSSLIDLLKRQTKIIEDAQSDFDKNNPVLNKTNKQVVGEAVGSALDVASLGSLSGIKTFKPVTKTLGRGLTEAGILSGVSGLSSGLQENKNTTGLLKSTGSGVATGLTLGGAFAGIGKVGNKISSKINDNIKDPVSGLEKSYNKIFRGTKSSVKEINKSLSKEKDPAKFLAERGLVIDVKDTKYDTKNVVNKIEEDANNLNNLLSEKLRSIKNKISFNDLEKIALEKVDNAQNRAENIVEDMQAIIKKEFAGYKKSYGDMIDLATLNEIKGAQWKKSKFDIATPALTSNTHKTLGNTLKESIEKVGEQNGISGIKKFNSLIGDHHDTLKNLAKIEGGTVKGGRLGGYFIKTAAGIGGLLAPSSGILNSALNATAGATFGGIVDNLSKKSSVLNPLSKLLLKKSEKITPNVVSKLGNNYLKNNQSIKAINKATVSPTIEAIPMFTKSSIIPKSIHNKQNKVNYASLIKRIPKKQQSRNKKGMDEIRDILRRKIITKSGE